MHDPTLAPRARDLMAQRWLRTASSPSPQAIPDLATATAVSGTNGHFRAVLSRQWDLCGPASGYLAAIALRAAGKIADLARPVSINVHFLGAAEFGEVELMVDAIKRGRRSETFSVSMSQERRPILEAIVRTAGDQQGYEHQSCEAPQVPRPEALPLSLDADQAAPRFAFWSNIERRSIPDERSRGALIEWTRFVRAASAGDAIVDAARSLILLDTYAWNAAARTYPTRYYDPTSLDTSVQFHRGNADSDWLLIEHSCPIAGEGLMGTSGRVWDCEGRLLATGITQLGCVPVR